MQRLVARKARQAHVGIVGAGFAGLRCADILLQNGFEVTILEARNRLGGRVAQSDHLGHSVDLWVHQYLSCFMSNIGFLSQRAKLDTWCTCRNILKNDED